MLTDEPDREAPTPRLTREWAVMRTAAVELSEQLRGRELVLDRMGEHLDKGRAALLRRARVVVDTYAAAFARWSTEAVPTLQKAREQSEFLLLVPFVRALTAEGP